MMVHVVITADIQDLKHKRCNNLAMIKIFGTDKYIRYLSKHLKKEHPKVKKYMKAFIKTKR